MINRKKERREEILSLSLCSGMVSSSLYQGQNKAWKSQIFHEVDCIWKRENGSTKRRRSLPSPGLGDASITKERRREEKSTPPSTGTRTTAVTRAATKKRIVPEPEEAIYPRWAEPGGGLFDAQKEKDWWCLNPRSLCPQKIRKACTHPWSSSKKGGDHKDPSPLKILAIHRCQNCRLQMRGLLAP